MFWDCCQMQGLYMLNHCTVAQLLLLYYYYYYMTVIFTDVIIIIIIFYNLFCVPSFATNYIILYCIVSSCVALQ